MMTSRRVSLCLVVVPILGLLLSCSSGPSEEELKLAALKQQLADIQQAYQTLQQARADLEANKATIAEIEAIAERQRSEEQTAQLEELTAGLPGAEEALTATFEGVQSQLQEFLNTALNEFPESPETAEGLNIYSAEAILSAREIVEKSGHYSKAIETLETAKNYYDMVGLPAFQPMVDTIAELDDWQFITEERFAEIKKGMTQDEVTAVAGVVYNRNIQEDPKSGVVTWLYKTRDGNAAAIYFNKKNTVYNMKWNALKTTIVQGE
jgi:hypothetical protein